MNHLIHSLPRIPESLFRDLSLYKGKILSIKETEDPFPFKSFSNLVEDSCQGCDNMVFIQILQHLQIHSLQAFCKRCKTGKEKVFLRLIEQIEGALGNMG